MQNPKRTDNKKEETQETRLPLSDPPPWFHAEMEKGFLRIQELIDGRLSKFAESLEKMGNELQSINSRMVDVETKQLEAEEAITGLHKDVADVKLAVDDEIKQLKDKIDELENQSRRQNLRLVGFPEGVEGRNAVVFLKEWLPKILGQEDEVYEIERAHRTLQRRPAENGKPRAILIRLLRYGDTLKILNVARERGKLAYGNSTIMIFRDMSSTLFRKRQEFSALKRQLRNNDVSYAMLHPATLRIQLPEGQRSFNSKASAETYLRQHHPHLIAG